jgi:hypothetical protein
LPFLLAKKEVYLWLREGKKTIDIRKGPPKPGEVAVFQCGPYSLKFKVSRVVSGQLSEVLGADNFRQVIPSAVCVEDAFGYLGRIYGDLGGVFTAYYLVPI